MLTKASGSLESTVPVLFLFLCLFLDPLSCSWFLAWAPPWLGHATDLDKHHLHMETRSVLFLSAPLCEHD